jgi:signal transduction histidine kinase
MAWPVSFWHRLDPWRRYVIGYALILSAGAIALVATIPVEWPGIVGMWVVGVSAGWMIGREGRHSLRRRIHRLREATDAIGRGQLDHRIELRGQDDFAKLAGSLERMAAQLETYIREREALGKELARVEKLALLGELSATVAHEVNNPLDGLQNAVRILLKAHGADAQSRALLELMDNGLQRIERIVQRLLGLARPALPQIEPVSLEEVLEDALLFVQPRLNRDGIKMERDWPAGGVAVLGDRMQLAQVLINLMLNAADAMPAGGKLKLAARLSAADATATLEISDTGAGIDPASLAHIFDPFYTTKRHGTGLGLAVVARVIEGHQGKIDVRSKVGEGTAFTIELPAAG